MQGAGVQQSVPMPPVKSLVVHRHTDADFQTKVSSGFPSLTRWSQYQRLAPLIVTLSNVSLKSTGTYCVLWQLTDAAGLTHFMHCTHIRKHYNLPGTLRTLQPNDVRLVSPFFNFSSAEYPSDPEQLTPRIPAQVPWLDAVTVTAQVDAIIAEDNTFEGQDLFQLRRQYALRRNAEHDAGVSLRLFLRKNPNATAQDIDAALSSLAAQSIVSSGTAANNIYEHGRAQEAQNLRGTLRWHGVAGVIQEAAKRARYNPDRIVGAAAKS